MADRTPSDSPLASDRLGPTFAAHAGEHNWTEGLPHDFKGWGPQTPDPEDEHMHDAYAGDKGLHWTGGEDSHKHIVWRFDRSRRH